MSSSSVNNLERRVGGKSEEGTGPVAEEDLWCEEDLGREEGPVEGGPSRAEDMRRT